MDSFELQHHGIKGQKWGRRRFQTNDGSLTAAGRKRYADDDSSGSSKSKTSAKSTASKSSSSKSKTSSSTTKKKTTKKKTTKNTSPASVVGKLAGTSVKTAVSLYAGPRVNSFMSTPTYRAFLSSPYATGTRYGTGWWLD